MHHSTIPFAGDVFFDIFGIDKTAVAQGDTELLPVEVHVFGVADGMFRFRVYICLLYTSILS